MTHAFICGVIVVMISVALGCERRHAFGGANARLGGRDDPILQRLSGAGAQVRSRRDIDGKRITDITFRNEKTIDPALIADLRRLQNQRRVKVRFENCRLSAAALQSLGRGDAPTAIAFQKCEVTADDIGSLNGAPRLVGIYFVADVSADDTTFSRSLSFPALEALRVDSTDVGDVGLRFLHESSHLRMFSASDTHITDATIESIADKSAIVTLGLCRTSVTDATLAIAARFPKLHNLEIAETRITDAGLANLKSIKRLGTLNLMHTNITDTGLAHLAHMEIIAKLFLRATKITDDGLRHLRGVRITELTLSDTETTDACLKYLRDIRGLHYVDIVRTGINPAAAVKALPRTSIVSK